MSAAQGWVDYSVDGSVALVTVQRPDKLDCLTPFMLDQLERIAQRVDGTAALRCVILSGAGTRAFCAGADIDAWSDLPPLEMWRSWVRRGHKVFDSWARMRVPSVAAINAHALGGGLELAAACDLRVAAEGASFGLPEASIVTCPGWSGTQHRVGLFGAAQVKYLALSGRRWAAAQALRHGLIHELAGADGVLDAARALAADVGRLAPVAVQLTKQVIDAGRGDALAVTLEAMAGALSAHTADASAGGAGFSH